MAKLGSDTGLILPAQVQAEIFGSCTASRVHMGVKFASFMGNRGVGLDPDPVSPSADPRTCLDLACTIVAYLALACALARGCWLIANGNYVGGIIWAAIPTLYVLTKLKSGLGGGTQHSEALLQSS